MPSAIAFGNSLLSSEAQVLWRYLRKLKSSEDALQALLAALVSLPTNAEGNAIREELNDLLPKVLKQPSDPKNLVQQPPFNMALATEMILHKAFKIGAFAKSEVVHSVAHAQKVPRLQRGRSLRNSSPPSQLISALLSSPTTLATPEISVRRNFGVVSPTPTILERTARRALEDNAAPRTTNSMVEDAGVVVSDSSTVGSELEEESRSYQQVLVGRSPAGRIKAANACWNVLFEAFSLQMALRTPARSRIYEVYRLSSPVYVSSDLRRAQRAVQNEFELTHDEACRVYIHCDQNELVVEVCVGDIERGSHRQAWASSPISKPKAEFIAVLNHGSSLLALTAKKAPSRSPFTQLVLDALDATLTTNSQQRNLRIDTRPQRVGDLTGLEPRELLNTAHSAIYGKSVGRFLHYAAMSSSAGPLSDMNKAVTSVLQCGSAAEKRFGKICGNHGREVAQMVENTGPQAVLVALNQTGVMIDHSAFSKSIRKRAREDDFGRGGDCPTMISLRWNWRGKTTATSACWEGDNGAAAVAAEVATAFKCSVTLRGANVADGLRALIDAGFAKAPMPDFVRDAPMKGSMTLSVDEREAFAEPLLLD